MVKIIAALVALLTASSAQADWQFTKWGMSESELKSLSANIIQTTAAESNDHSNPSVGRALYKSGYRASDVDFAAYFWFNAGRLVAVELTPRNITQDGPKVNITLGQIYGAPIEDKSRSMVGGNMFCNVIDRKWRSEREANVITAYGMTCNKGNTKDIFNVRYTPILSSGSSGL
jgi:hypothetical protein